MSVLAENLLDETSLGLFTQHSADDSLNLFSSFLFWIFDFTVVEEVYAYPFPTIQEYKRNMQVLHVICA